MNCSQLLLCKTSSSAPSTSIESIAGLEMGLSVYISEREMQSIFSFRISFAPSEIRLLAVSWIVVESSQGHN